MQSEIETKLDKIFDKLIAAVGKRSSEEYTQISAYLPKELAKDFRPICSSRKLEHSGVLEKLLTTWVAENKR